MRYPSLVLLVLLSMSGCATPPPSGPVVRTEFSEGGVTASVKKSLDDVDNRAKSVFRQLDIQLTGSKLLDEGRMREMTGKLGDYTVVKVLLASEHDSTTSIEIQAVFKVAQNEPRADKELARQLLSFILPPG